MEKLTVEIIPSGYTGLTPQKVEDALNYYFGSMASFSVMEVSQQSAEEQKGICNCVGDDDFNHLERCPRYVAPPRQS